MTPKKTTTKRQQTATNFIWLHLLLLACIFGQYVTANPMLYKKNNEDKYEADLVPVSSTVIPLSVLEVSYGLGGKPSEEYKEAYLKKLRKKVQKTDAENDETEWIEPDTLITIKNVSTKAKVKGISNN